jgi:hypothetical protein
MREIMLGILVIAGSYMGSAAFAIVLFRIFFPLKTKMTNAIGTMNFTYSKNKSIQNSPNRKVQVVSVGGNRGWVKMNS